MITLNGVWEFRFDDQAAWQPLEVPGCWDVLPGASIRPGPAWYRTQVLVPAEWAGQRIWLRFGGVSYHCRVLVNGQVVGSHTGLWDAFSLEITAVVTPGVAAELLVYVEKPAGLRAGPASEPVAGNFPLKQTLSGFLPYVWGQIFGGIWQDVTLYATAAICFDDVLVQGTPDGQVTITVKTSAPTLVGVEIYDPERYIATPPGGDGVGDRRDARYCAATHTPDGADTSLHITLPNPRPWSPGDPALYTAVLRLASGDEYRVRFGLRQVRSEATTILLNGQPLYLRLALSWGWYANSLHSNPGPARVRADMLKLKALGYNGIKLCLWFPPPYYFEIADELGMLLWVELPMWLPQPSAFFRQQVPLEYQRLVRLARIHPAVVIYTLGCELNRAVGSDMLGPLYTLVKTLGGDALVRDNSGSGEAYGGLLAEHADFYDYHFYSDLPFLRELLDHFAPRWRTAQPWLFGEFCDYDDLHSLISHRGHREHRDVASNIGNQGVNLLSSGPPSAPSVRSVAKTWWLASDTARNPQGARWQMDVPFQEERLRANQMWRRGAELERISLAQGLFHRKYTLELVRAYHEVAGYVVTGEVDTPIASAGMLDDAGELKYAPETFSCFNNDLVLLVGWGKRRAWLAGGDRAARYDPWCYTAGALIRPHLIAAHYGLAHGPAHVRWAVVGLDTKQVLASGETTTGVALAPGALREVAVAELLAPVVTTPRRLLLRASLTIGDQTANNQWPLWVFPREPWAGLHHLALHDPAGVLGGLPLANDQRPFGRLRAGSTTNDQQPGNDGRTTTDRGRRPSFVVRQSSQVIIATAWSAALDVWVRSGGKALLVQPAVGPPGPLPTVALPFWREAIRICEPHPAWGDFPYDDAVGAQFLAFATDYALDSSAYPAAQPILRRLDGRTMAVHDYAVALAWGAGKLIITTLRFGGGQGEQPLGIERSPAANYLLCCWARYLADEA